MSWVNAFKNKETSRAESDELLVSRLPILFWIIMVYVASILLQNLIEITLFNSLLFSLVYVFHAILYWNSHRITTAKPWLYFLVQGLLITFCALLIPSGSPAVLIGLFPVLIGQSIGFYFQKTKIFIVTMYCAALFFYTIQFVGDRFDFILLIPLFILMLIVVVAYAQLFFDQVHARLRMQTFLRDLEKAHRKVEELTLAHERQRMARDLHDTLAQGVAGFIMQLEAADAFIVQGNIVRAQEIIQQSMGHARRTLADARMAIDNLRLESAAEVDFREAVQNEVRRFIQATGIDVSEHIEIASRPSRVMMEHSLHILSECLTNVAKHARADQVWVSMFERNRRIHLEIRDNGIGFNTELIGKKPGHYGILGLQERARLIEGEVKITSSPKGTQICLEAPFKKE